MKFKGFRFEHYWNFFVVFPTIIIFANEQRYFSNNLSIQIHWLGFHLRWLWEKGNENFVSAETYPDKRAELKIKKKNQE